MINLGKKSICSKFKRICYLQCVKSMSFIICNFKYSEILECIDKVTENLSKMKGQRNKLNLLSEEIENICKLQHL